MTDEEPFIRLHDCPIHRTAAAKRLYKARRFHEITYPVSYRYSGGIVVGNAWYRGYIVPKPVVPAGWEIVGLGVGLQLNCRPPYATAGLQPIKNKVKHAH